MVTAQRSARPRLWGFFGVLVIVTLMAYRPAWHGGLLWDDDAHVTAPEMRTAEGLRRIWVEPGAVQQYYPLVHTVFWLLAWAAGDGTLAYHLLNIVLHAISACLVAVLLRRLGVPGARLAAVVFALHPVHVESVAWISELKNALSGVLYLSAGLAYLRFDAARGKGAYAAAFALFVLALLSKTVTATLPAALLVIFWWKRGAVSWRRDVRPLLPFFVAAAAAAAGTVWMEQAFIGARGTGFELTIMERVLVAGRALWFYPAKLLWPADLAFIYPRWQISAGSTWQYLFPISAMVVAAVLWKLRHRSRAPLAALLIFGGTLFPALGFFNVFPFRYSFVADHFQYLPSIAIIALVSAGLVLGLVRAGIPARRAEPAAIAVVMLPLAMLTWHQSGHYADAATLYRETLAVNPRCWLCHNNLAIPLLAEGRIEDALARADASLAIQFENPEAHNLRGVALRALGRLDAAREAHTHAAAQLPTLLSAHHNLGVVAHEQGRLQDAERHYRDALRLNPSHGETRRNLGLVFTQMGRADEALAEMREAVRLSPRDTHARLTLGTALLRAGRLDEAATELTEALRLDPSSLEAGNNLGAVLERLGRHDEALARYTATLTRHPQSARTHDNAGSLLASRGRLAEAKRHFEEAIRLQPAYLPARVNLADILQALDRPAEAIPHYEAALSGASGKRRVDLHNNLGVAYARLGRRAEALAQFREALRLDPADARARGNLARALEQR